MGRSKSLGSINSYWVLHISSSILCHIKSWIYVELVVGLFTKQDRKFPILFIQQFSHVLICYWSGKLFGCYQCLKYRHSHKCRDLKKYRDIISIYRKIFDIILFYIWGKKYQQIELPKSEVLNLYVWRYWSIVRWFTPFLLLCCTISKVIKYLVCITGVGPLRHFSVNIHVQRFSLCCSSYWCIVLLFT